MGGTLLLRLLCHHNYDADADADADTDADGDAEANADSDADDHDHDHHADDADDACWVFLVNRMEVNNEYDQGVFGVFWVDV